MIITRKAAENLYIYAAVVSNIWPKLWMWWLAINKVQMEVKSIKNRILMVWFTFLFFFLFFRRANIKRS